MLLPLASLQHSTCASYICSCRLRGEYCNDYCFCSGRSCSNRLDGLLVHSPRVTPTSSPIDASFLARSAGLTASSPIVVARTWDTLSNDVFGTPKQLHTTAFFSPHLSVSAPSAVHFGSPGSPPLSPSKSMLRTSKKKHFAALNIPRTPGPSPSSVSSIGSPTSLLAPHLHQQPNRFHFLNAPSPATAHPPDVLDQYEADRNLFVQYYMLIAEEFLLNFFDAWHANSLHTLLLFRDSSELSMDQQLYLGSDCLIRLSEEFSLLNPNHVDVMPSREGFDIGIAVSGDLKVRHTIHERLHRFLTNCVGIRALTPIQGSLSPSPPLLPSPLCRLIAQF